MNSLGDVRGQCGEGLVGKHPASSLENKVGVVSAAIRPLSAQGLQLDPTVAALGSALTHLRDERLCGLVFRVVILHSSAARGF